MTKSSSIIFGSFFVAVIAVIFCVWIALGNDVNFCVTTGCTLYQDFSFFGISLWWFGAFAFVVLGICALAGKSGTGRFFAAFFLFCDIFFLALMAVTAPCISCLLAAAFFALSYLSFKPDKILQKNVQNAFGRRYSYLLWIWLLFFVVNIGAVARSQFDVWPILDESEDARIKMFFSPSCTYCIDGINILSGNINAAFYPVAENEQDIFKLYKMQNLLKDGMSIAEALKQSADAEILTGFSVFSPKILLLRFRLLRNKAHIFAAGSQMVPFFETHGLPGDIMAKIREKKEGKKIEKSVKPVMDMLPKDPNLPLELDISAQCQGNKPCPPIF